MTTARQAPGAWCGVLAVGPFDPSIAHCLGYRAERFARVSPGATVITQLFDVARDPGELGDLALALGFDPGDATTHALDASRAQVDLLEAFSDEAVRFVALRAAGFAFFFYEWDDDASVPRR
jgi:hypothetical protein